MAPEQVVEAPEAEDLAEAEFPPPPKLVLYGLARRLAREEAIRKLEIEAERRLEAEGKNSPA